MVLQYGASGERLYAYITIIGHERGATIEVAQCGIHNNALLNYIHQYNAIVVSISKSVAGFWFLLANK